MKRRKGTQNFDDDGSSRRPGRDARRQPGVERPEAEWEEIGVRLATMELGRKSVSGLRRKSVSEEIGVRLATMELGGNRCQACNYGISNLHNCKPGTTLCI